MLKERGSPTRAGRGLILCGPGFVAAVAYIDPGNFAVDFQAGRFGYGLLWVVVAANLIGMFVQYLALKATVASGLDLPTLCGRRYRRPVVWLLWAQAEVVAMATDLAELVGAAVGLNLLFGVPLVAAVLINAVVGLGMLVLPQHGYRPFELAITALLGLVACGFGYDLLALRHRLPGGVLGGLVPSFGGGGSVTLAVGLLGATVMPHVVYLHGALVVARGTEPGDTLARRLRSLRLDCVLGIGMAGLVNVAMLCVAAGLFVGGGGFDGTLAGAQRSLLDTAGGLAALAFAVALLSSGVSSTGVGTYAGQVIMSGFVGLRLPPLARRLITMAPALVVLVLGVRPDTALVASQVVLSFGIPFALVPLVLITRDRAVMGDVVNRRVTTCAGAVIAGLIILLNAYLLIQF
jgi:manganese transport protein